MRVTGKDHYLQGVLLLVHQGRWRHLDDSRGIYSRSKMELLAHDEQDADVVRKKMMKKKERAEVKLGPHGTYLGRPFCLRGLLHQGEAVVGNDEGSWEGKGTLAFEVFVFNAIRDFQAPCEACWMAE